MLNWQELHPAAAPVPFNLPSMAFSMLCPWWLPSCHSHGKISDWRGSEPHWHKHSIIITLSLSLSWRLLIQISSYLGTGSNLFSDRFFFLLLQFLCIDLLCVYWGGNGCVSTAGSWCKAEGFQPPRASLISPCKSVTLQLLLTCHSQRF